MRVYFVGRRGKDAQVYDEAAVRERFGVPPWRLPSFVALLGDPSDNLPGVPGIGTATAKKLLANRENIGELLRDAPQLSPARTAQLLLAHADQMRQTEQLARLREDAPLPAPPYVALATPVALGAVRAWFAELEFSSLLPRLDKLLAAQPATPRGE